jgi:Chromosome segregation ATPases
MDIQTALDTLQNQFNNFHTGFNIILIIAGFVVTAFGVFSYFVDKNRFDKLEKSVREQIAEAKADNKEARNELKNEIAKLKKGMKNDITKQQQDATKRIEELEENIKELKRRAETQLAEQKAESEEIIDKIKITKEEKEAYDSACEEAEEACEAKKYEKAIEICTKAIGLKPRTVAALYWRSLAYYNKEERELDLALADINDALKIYKTGKKYQDLKAKILTAIENQNNNNDN